MSAVTADAPVNHEIVNNTPDPQRTESKFSLAMDAVTKSKSHAGESVRAYLDVLNDVLKSFAPVQLHEGAFDVRIMFTINESCDYINQFRNLLAVIAEADNVESLTDELAVFLDGVLDLKKNAQFGDNAAYLWRDALSFIAREIFLSVIAALLANNAWTSARRLLDRRYTLSNSETGVSFHAFDSFQRSLDVFRNRRLKLRRASVAADVLKDRIQESALSFDDVMQADFVLHVYSLLHHDSPMHRWHARTLGSAHEFAVTGFGLFVDARARKDKALLSALFGVSDWAQFEDKLVAAVSESALIDASRLDYAGFVAANREKFKASS